ncbi:MAG: 30S ribosomal protein S18 [Spirochaetales bacterium]|nr:30S ribosomal protein S18 [Spirochaetales bacterium]
MAEEKRARSRDDARLDERNDQEEMKDGKEYRDNKGGGRGGKPFFRKKVCRFCTGKSEPDYKNFDILRRYVTERGKILPRRITGTCAKHQRAVALQVKRARVLAYLPFVKK